MGVTIDTATTAVTIGTITADIIIAIEFGLSASMVVPVTIAIGETPTRTNGTGCYELRLLLWRHLGCRNDFWQSVQAQFASQVLARRSVRSAGERLSYSRTSLSASAGWLVIRLSTPISIIRSMDFGLSTVQT